MAQGLAFGLGRPLIGVSTLEALALAAHRQHHLRYVIPALDARMNEIYVAAYHCQDGRLTSLLEEAVMAPSRLRLPRAERDVDWSGVGSGWALWDTMQAPVQAALGQRLPDMQPAAADMVRLAAENFAAGGGQPAHEAVPIYLRDRVAWQRG